jgi:hypothetical protein
MWNGLSRLKFRSNGQLLSAVLNFQLVMFWGVQLNLENYDGKSDSLLVQVVLFLSLYIYISRILGDKFLVNMFSAPRD